MYQVHPLFKIRTDKNKIIRAEFNKKSIHLNKTRIYFLNMPIYKKVVKGGKTKIYFFGISCYKARQDKNTTKHYIFGLKIATSKKNVCWRPIASAFKDKKRG